MRARRALPFTTLAVLFVSSAATAHLAGQNPAAPCCNITSVNANGLVTAQEIRTGSRFQFRVADKAVLAGLHVGQQVWADFAKQAVALAAGATPWAQTYRRVAAGMLIAFGMLVVLSTLAVQGGYHTGSATSIGWMLTFWFSAWAAATAPASPAEFPSSIAQARRLSQPRALFIAIVLVPIVGYGARFLVPLGEPLDGRG